MSERPYGPQAIWILAVLLASICFGLVPVFARWLGAAGVAPELIAFYRFPVIAILLLPAFRLRGGSLRATGMGMLAGAAMGLGWIGYVMTLERTSVATAGVLYLTYPLFTMVFALVLLRQRPGLMGILAAAMVAGAGWLVVAPGEAGALTLDIVALGLVAPASFGFGITVLTGWLGALNPLHRMGAVALGACVGLAPLVAQHPVAEIVPGPDTLPIVAGIAICTALVPGLIYVIAAPRIGALKTAVAGSIELPTMFVLGWWVFAETLTDRQMAAGAMVVAAIIVISLSRTVRVRAHTI